MSPRSSAHEMAVIDLARRQLVIRPKDLAAIGIPTATLTTLVRRGLLERTGRGLYIAPDAAHEYLTLAEATRRAPTAVICLLSALAFHEIGTQLPREIWIALDPHTRAPRADWPPLKIVRFGGVAMTRGVETHDVGGVPIRVTDPARTVVDCFRYRHKIGIDVAIEALRDYVDRKLGSLGTLLSHADALRAGRVIRPYVEALA